MKFNPKAYLIYFLMDKFKSEPNDKNFKEYLEWLDPLGDFKMDVTKMKYDQKDDYGGTCTIHPYSYQYTINIGTLYISGTYGIDELIIDDGSFKDNPNTRLRVVYNNKLLKKGVKRINAIIRSGDKSFNGIYLYKNNSSTIFNMPSPLSLAFYDEDTYKFLSKDLKISEEQLLQMTEDDFKKLGLEPDIFINPEVEDDELAPSLKEIVTDFNFEDFKKFVENFGINKGSKKTLEQ